MTTSMVITESDTEKAEELNSFFKDVFVSENNNTGNFIQLFIVAWMGSHLKRNKLKQGIIQQF